MKIKNVTLEMSLKPFKSTEPAFVAAIINKLFTQWQALTKHADMLSVLLWTADGSEILDYRGNMAEELEWARYVGGATRKMALKPGDPEQIGLHSRPYLYMDEPPIITYATLAEIVAMIREIGSEHSGKPVRVGATFDPGPEFAKSPFKYERHNEICLGDTMGRSSAVAAHSVLNADDVSYAGFPNGIPQGLPFGTFFGRQCQHFLTDLGFDYIWFSNGFGFGAETWGVRGALFDGERFDVTPVDQLAENILNFWHLFRAECPDCPIETRGTNLSTAIDLSTDGVPLKQIYEGGFDILPPPNSPWAAINGDFGIELAGHMSRICELPGKDYPFRFYVHDPWWMNSPWLDRYGREAHDIYLPLALTRINDKGEAQAPNHIQFLTVDNTLGGIPEQAPNEVIPHILAAMAEAPDAPSPLVWVYPFDEYHRYVRSAERMPELFFGDWFMRDAIQNGLPVSSVISTGNFIALMDGNPDKLAGVILVSPVPEAGSPWERGLLARARAGERILLYGPLHHASDDLLTLLNVSLESPIHDDLRLTMDQHLDSIRGGRYAGRIVHRPSLSAGGMAAALIDDPSENVEVCAMASNGREARVAALVCSQPTWRGGAVGWVRGTLASRTEPGERMLVPDDPGTVYPSASLMRLVLSRLGIEIGIDMPSAATRPPVTLVSRYANAFFFCGFTPDTTAGIRLRFPQGAPLFLGYETELVNGCATYHMPRAWRRECRVFVQQTVPSVLSCVEVPAVSFRGRRKISVSGLVDATVRFYPETGFEESTKTLLNSPPPYLIGEPVVATFKRDNRGVFIEAINVTGALMFTWDLPLAPPAEVDHLTATYDWSPVALQ